MIQAQRIKLLNDKEERKGKYVLYWMQQSQRTECNHALEYAIRKANELGLPLVVIFGITQRFPKANLRHYAFMLEGLLETKKALEDKGIRFVLRLQPPQEAAVVLGKDAAVVIADRGYLSFQRGWRAHVAERVPCKVVQVESDVVVPVELVSQKEEYAARTIRPKIHRLLEDFLKPLKEIAPQRDSLSMKFDRVEMTGLDSLLNKLRIDKKVGQVTSYHGGTSEARRHLSEFLSSRLNHYVDERNEPHLDCVSHISPYLHFGQISPLFIALKVLKARGIRKENREAFLEELIVRRELSMNFCFYNSQYDSYSGLPEWARKTLELHRKDKREYPYTIRDLKHSKTHDTYWNAAQKEMVLTGKMHNYMRMYWGKKIIEWSETPEEAFERAIYLNNKYELDGRDPNSFAGVAWCFGKHDRPWKERSIFGTVRYMNSSGLERKFNMEAYVRKVEDLHP
jgi:deoxyribodipyrimidine photo-lyase